MIKKLLLPATIIIALVFLSSWYVFGRKNKCPRSFEPIMSTEPYYKSLLFDAHLHLPTEIKVVSDIAAKTGNPIALWDSELSLNYLKCLFDKEGAYGAYGFHLFTKYYMDAEVKMAKKIEKKYPGMIVHFLMPTIISEALNPDLDKLEEILNDNPGLFRGLGELKMYDGKAPDDPYLLGLVDLARKHNLIVMMHPFDHHKKGVERIVRLYSDVTFLFHGIVEDIGPAGIKNNINWLDQLMVNNRNVFYSVDGGLQIYGWEKKHQGKVLSKEELLPVLKSNFKKQLETDLANYKSIIEKHPDRFLRGTDRFYRPHFDREISSLLEEYTRAFIARLAPSVQEKFAHTNADALLKK